MPTKKEKPTKKQNNRATLLSPKLINVLSMPKLGN